MPTFNPTRGGVAVLDYDVSDDLKYYHKACKGLDGSLKYDMSPSKLKAFLDQVRKRSKQFGWNAVLTVPTIVGLPLVPINRNILDSYGTVTLEECQAHARTYMIANVTRIGQDSVMLYNFLFDSLTTEGLNKVNIDPTSFTVNGEQDGLCFLRTIITKAQMDTIGTVQTLRNAIGALPTKMVELTANVEEFHQHVNTLPNALDSYGQPYPELIMNLFKAYALIEDNDFKTYVLYLRFGYNANPEDYNSRTLMNNVENAYKLRVEEGTWTPGIDKKTDEITALRAEIEAFKTAVSNNTGRGSGGGNGNGRLDSKARAEKYAWKKIPPASGESKTKTFEERVYHWCGHHKMWTMHTEAQCDPNRRSNNQGAANNAPAEGVATAPQAMSTNVVNNDTPARQVQVNEAMATLVRYANDDDY
jgi:hypothetical protein